MPSALPAPSASAVRSLRGREILDSRGRPTVEAEVVLVCGASGRAAVPAGASRGSREVCESRDRDPGRHNGLGALAAARALCGEIARALAGRDAENIPEIDRVLAELDPAPDKSRLGGNASLAASLACAKAAANAANAPLHARLPLLLRASPPPPPGRPRLPVPMMNILNGGAHASNNLDIQEFMIVPAGFASFPRALQAGAEIFHALREILLERGFSAAVGDEGGFAPDLPTHESALALLTDAIHRAGYAPGENVWLALDCAANELRGDDGFYRLGPESFCGNAADLAEIISNWAEKYALAAVEDPAAEDDFAGWENAAAKFSGRMLVVGDDVFATHADSVREGVARGPGQRAAGEAEPGRGLDGGLGGGLRGADRRLENRDVAPLGRDRGRFAGGLGGGVRGGLGEIRRALPGRAHREIQPPDSHRGGNGIGGGRREPEGGGGGMEFRGKRALRGPGGTGPGGVGSGPGGVGTDGVGTGCAGVGGGVAGGGGVGAAMIRTALLALALAGSGWLQYSAHFGYDGRVKSGSLSAEIAAMRGRNDRLSAENERLRTRARELKTDPARAEELARNWLMMTKPGEVLFLPAERESARR